jgi:hypothetical protein
MKKLLVISACLLALSLSPAQGFAAEPEVVVVRVHESLSKVELVITRPNGQSETIGFEGGTKKMAAAGVGYQQVVTKLYQEGYGLTSTFSTTFSTQVGLTITTLIFTKGD